MIRHDGYSYILHNIDKKYPTRHWHCNKSGMGCKVRLKLLDDRMFFKTFDRHNHPPCKSNFNDDRQEEIKLTTQILY